jgi:hypothetical protein
MVCKHLSVLEREGLIQIWNDQKLQAGEDWESRLYQELLDARIAVLMISSSFLTSDFILNVEVRKLFEQCEREGTIIYPILIRPCAWEEVSVGCQGSSCAPPVPGLRQYPPFEGRSVKK